MNLLLLYENRNKQKSRVLKNEGSSPEKLKSREKLKERNEQNYHENLEVTKKRKKLELNGYGHSGKIDYEKLIAKEKYPQNLN